MARAHRVKISRPKKVGYGFQLTAEPEAERNGEEDTGAYVKHWFSCNTSLEFRGRHLMALS